MTRNSGAFFVALDQIMITVAGLGASLMVARSVDAAAFGGFALVLAARAFLVEFGRAMCGQPFQILYGRRQDIAQPEREPKKSWRRNHERVRSRDEAVGFGFSAGALAGAALLVASLIVGSASGFLTVLAISAPFVVAQDVVRHVLMAEQGGGSIAQIDGLALVVQFIISVRALSVGAEPWWFLAAWGIGLAVSSVFSLVRFEFSVGWRTGRTWAQEAGELWPGLLTDAGLVQAQRQLSAWSMLWFGSLASVGGFRGAHTLFRPVGLASTGTKLAALPSLSLGLNGVRRVRLVSVWLVVLAGAGTVVLLTMTPPAVGTALLGDTWSVVTPFIFPVGIIQAAQGAALGPQLLIMRSQNTAGLARVRAALLVPQCGLLVLGGLLGGAVGAAYGLAIASSLAAIYWWAQLPNASPQSDGEDATDLDSLGVSAS